MANAVRSGGHFGASTRVLGVLLHRLPALAVPEMRHDTGARRAVCAGPGSMNSNTRTHHANTAYRGMQRLFCLRTAMVSSCLRVIQIAHDCRKEARCSKQLAAPDSTIRAAPPKAPLTPRLRKSRMAQIARRRYCDITGNCSWNGTLRSWKTLI